MDLLNVTFNSEYGPYNAGDHAGFLPDEATRLCSTPTTVAGRKIMLARLTTQEELEAVAAQRAKMRQPGLPPDLVRVIITAPDVGMYNRGDDPSLSKEDAARLIREEKAMPYTDPEEVEEPPKPKRRRGPRSSPKTTDVKEAQLTK